jgi:amphi-Trp domain-containing protein
MAKHKAPTEFEYESLQDSESIAKYLEALKKGFTSGQLLFCSGKQEMLLNPQGLLKFVVHAKRRDGQVKVDLQIAWKEHRSRQKPGDRLTIRSEPATDE